MREFARDPQALSYLARELGGALGAFLDPAPGGVVRCLSVDIDGELWCIAEGERADLVRWCVRRSLRFYFSLGALVGAFRAGVCVGFVPPWAELCAVRLSDLDPEVSG